MHNDSFLMDIMKRGKNMLETLKTISGPEDIKKLNTEELGELAQDIRSFLVQSLSQTGGHLASNLGVDRKSVV